MADTHLALLRGINVGGKNKLPMSDLRDLFAAVGCRDVRTYIQSGNVVFQADLATVASLSEAISQLIAERFGYRVPVVLRTAAEVGAAIEQNPFRAQGAAEETLHVYFLAAQPDAAQIAALDPDRSPPDRFIIQGREVYLHLPNGMGRTKLTNDYFDTKLRTVSTARNWRTITTLHAMMTE